MSFLNIKDPARRDELVRQYANTLHSIQQSNLNERLQNTTDEKELAKVFSPVVKATEAVKSTITKELNPLTKDVRSLVDGIKAQSHMNNHIKTEEEEDNAIAAYYLTAKINGKDTVYGIFTNAEGKLQMGTKPVFIQDNNIIVDDVIHKGTKGLWSLVMDTHPNELLYSAKDMESYKKLLRDTNVIFEPNRAGSTRRPRNTTKWVKIIQPLIHNDNHFFSTEKKEGKGLQVNQKHQKQIAFLPGDVSGLMSKMKLLLAEFLAGNTAATRNELVSVLDELKRHKKLSNKDYNQINVLLSQTKN